MTTFIALLRAVNLGPHNKISMADLKAFITALGYSDATTLLQSGNVVFRGKPAAADAVARRLETEAVKRLKLDTPFIVRTADDWKAVVAGNPFPKEAKADPGRMVAMCLKDPVTPAAVKALQDAIKGREVVKARGDVAYFVYPDGQGTSKLTITVIEKKLGTTGTARNWNTVLKIADLVGTLRS